MPFKIVLVVQLLCTAAVFCRTAQDVMNDFEPVFEERHNQFREIKNAFEVDTLPYFESFTDNILNEENNLRKTLIIADETIHNETTKYLEDTGMINQPEKIVHCTNDLKTNQSNVHNFAKAGERLCNQVASKNISRIIDYYEDIMIKLSNEHKIIEVTREECIKLKDPFDVQTCVINDLYIFYLPYIADVKMAISIYLQEIANGVQGGIKQNEACFDLVSENAKTDAQKVIDDFLICVWFAIGTKA